MIKTIYIYILTLALSMIFILSCSSSSSTNGLQERKEGDILWQRDDLGENLESAPAIDDSGNVYVIGDGTVHSFNLDGELRWSTETSPGDACTPSVSHDNRILFTNGVDGVFALNAANGAILWHNPIGEFHTVAAQSTDGNRIYLGAGHESGNSDNFYAMNVSDGSVAWTFVLDAEAQRDDIRGFMGGAVLDDNGTIYVSSQHGYLISLTDNGEDYTENWRFNYHAEARQPMTLGGDGYIYITSNTGKVHKVDIASGIEVTTGNWPALGNVGEVFASMCLGPDGTVYVNAEDYNLHALNPDGSEKWSYQFDRWGSDPLVRDDGMIIVMGQVEGAGRVCAIRDNGTTASLVWKSPKILNDLTLNETNVNIAPDGTIFVHSGDQPPLGLFALMGNGSGLNTVSPWPKYMGNIKNNGMND
jgi:outer membrane protein assembly factor BamB